MRNIDEYTITEAVLQSFAGCKSDRLREILTSLVCQLHDFARNVKLTEQEWKAGVDFLTATGHMCDDKRQEFILLSDVLGLSMLTVSMNHPSAEHGTESTVFGPFHVEGAPHLAQGADVSSGAPGEPLYVQVGVSGPDGKPVPDAEVDVWAADAEGLYDVQRADLAHAQGRAVLRTDASGQLRFKSVLPVGYPIPTDGPVGKLLGASGRHPWRPAHIHFMIQAPGYRTLVTHVFRDGDQYLDSDAVFGVRNSLVADFRSHEPGMAPDGSSERCVFHTLTYQFVLTPATH